VAPVVAQIGKKSFVGVRFAEDCDGVYAERLYLLGELPPLFRRRHVSFHAADQDQDWFLTSWFRRLQPTIEYDEACPFGTHFILTMYISVEQWELQSNRKHRRLSMKITEVGPTKSNIGKSSTEKK
jgi:hypothetical protein